MLRTVCLQPLKAFDPIHIRASAYKPRFNSLSGGDDVARCLMLHRNIILSSVESLQSTRGSQFPLDRNTLKEAEKIVADTKQKRCRNCCVLRTFRMFVLFHSLTFFSNSFILLPLLLPQHFLVECSCLLFIIFSSSPY